MTKLTKGYVQVYTGNGKGKTTAAIGLAIRAAGYGLKVFIAQFIKGMKYSEIKALERFDDLITVKQYGRGCFIRGKPSAKDIELASMGVDELEKIIISGKYDLIILDEIIVAGYFNLIGKERILKLIELRPDNIELVLTGRKADRSIIEAADLVTEMKEIKHYYNDGVNARKGIES